MLYENETYFAPKSGEGACPSSLFPRKVQNLMSSSGSTMDWQSTLADPDRLNRDATERKWQHYFPDEPYDIEDFGAVELDIKYEQRSRYNLIAAAERQRDFYYNVSLPHYRHHSFLCTAVDRWFFMLIISPKGLLYKDVKMTQCKFHDALTFFRLNTA